MADPADPRRLRLIASPVPPAAVLERIPRAASSGLLVAGPDRLVVGEGTAATLELPHGLSDAAALGAAVAWLAAAARGSDGAAQRRLVALGAFPFDPAAPAALVVPSVSYCLSADGDAWMLQVDGADTGFEPPDGEDAGPSVVAAVSFPSADDYVAAVAAALADIRRGVLHKVVLSRLVQVRMAHAPDAAAILGRLWHGEDIFRPFSLPSGGARLVGASPELVVGRLGDRVASRPLAGTVALDGDEARAQDAERRLLASAKDRAEHRLVVDEVAAALAPRCSHLEVPAKPSVVRLGSDARLGTLVEGTLHRASGGAPPASEDSALHLLASLHPTPAVAGVPRPAALAAIARLEPAARGLWAGAVGWVDGSGDGEWMLAIRSVVLEGDDAAVRAGAGIVDGSQPQSELAEVTVKLRPVLEALSPGASALL